MKLEDIKNKTKEATDYLVQSLEAGHSEVLTQYLGAMAKFHTYSFGKHIIAQLRLTAQRSLMQSSSYRHFFPNMGSERPWAVGHCGRSVANCVALVYSRLSIY